MSDQNNMTLQFKDWRKDGELDKAAPLFASIYEDLCERLVTGVVRTGVGSVTTEVTMFDYQRTDTGEFLLYRWTQTSQVAGLHFPKKTTRYSIAKFEGGKIVEILPMFALKGQAVAWWIGRNQSPIAKIRERGWL
jgi:hypothetical protein